MGKERLKVLGIAGGVVALIAIGGFLFMHFHADSDVLSADASTARSVVPQRPNGLDTATSAYTGPALTGSVKTATGLPVAKARVTVSTARDMVTCILDSGISQDTGGGSAETGTDGVFTVQPSSRPRAVFVRCAQGYAIAMVAASAGSGTSPVQIPPLVLRPWGRIVVSFGAGVPDEGARLNCSANDQLANGGVFLGLNSIAKPGGSLVLDQVPPGNFALGIRRAEDSHFYTFNVQAGQTVTAEIGKPGRAVIGHLAQPAVAFAYRRATLVSQSAAIPESVGNTIARDGTFRMEGIPPGNYKVLVQLAVLTDKGYVSAGDAQQDVVIAASSDKDDKPVDLGAINVKVPEKFAIGQGAPAVSGTAADGSQVSLSNFLGKYVLLSVAGGPTSTGWADVLALRALYDRFGNNPRLATITACVGNEIASARLAAQQGGVSWPLLDCGSSMDAMPKPFTGGQHAVSVIDPKGAILVNNVDAIRASAVLDAVLKSSIAGNANGIQVQIDHLSPADVGKGMPFKHVPPPSVDDAGSRATIRVIDGPLPDGPNPSACLNDGKMPSNDDSREENFRFAIGCLEGRVQFDLASAIDVAEIRSYSWHSNSRAPQLYRVFGADGATSSFDSAPKNGFDPVRHGWTLIAEVDSRSTAGRPGGKDAVSITRASGSLGTYRYLLFQMFPSETDDANGNTFYSEIDVIARK